MIIKSPEELSIDQLYIQLEDIVSAPVYVKCEGYNAAGSIKLKPALYMIQRLEEKGLLKPGCEIIESSSGNLGVALGIICAKRGYKFTCVTDPVSTESVRHAIKATGASLLIIEQEDQGGGGYLQSRINTIKKMCKENPRLVWINQYANDDNWLAHYYSTAKEINETFPKPDWLFIGAGTTGTLMGCYHYFKEHSPNTRIIGIDALGSVTFGGTKYKRHIPGLGTSRCPEIFQQECITERIIVSELETIKACHHWASKGYFFGGSTGTVLAGVQKYSKEISQGDTVVTISPDFGEKYMNTIYNPQWVDKYICPK